MSRSYKKLSIGDIFFDSLNIIFMLCISFATLYPFLYILSQSLGGSALTSLGLIPKNISFSAYEKVLTTDFVINGFYNTIIRTVLGTILTLLFTICTAYPLSKRYFPNRSFWTGFIVFTMFFSGGLIPSYLLVRGLHLNNTVWSLVLPGLIGSFNMIIMRNFFMSIPESMEESAKIDGANDIVILFLIIVPTSLSIIATIFLWAAVGHWNAWFDCLIYITEPTKHVLQLILRRVVIEGTTKFMNLDNTYNDNYAVSTEAVKSATIMVTTMPIILLYPFVQKYFVKGIMVGSLKG